MPVSVLSTFQMLRNYFESIRCFSNLLGFAMTEAFRLRWCPVFVSATRLTRSWICWVLASWYDILLLIPTMWIRWTELDEGMQNCSYSSHTEIILVSQKPQLIVILFCWNFFLIISKKSNKTAPTLPFKAGRYNWSGTCNAYRTSYRLLRTALLKHS